MCEGLLKDYIINLDIISRIPRNGQLDTTGTSIDIYAGGVFAWINRKIMGDGKEETVKFLDTFYGNLKKFAHDYCMHAKKRDLQALITAIENSKSGLVNLSETYKKYTKISVAIDNIHKKTISDIIADIHEKRPDCLEEGKQRTVVSESGAPVTSSEIGVGSSGSGSSKSVSSVSVEPEKENE